MISNIIFPAVKWGDELTVRRRKKETEAVLVGIQSNDRFGGTEGGISDL